MEGSSSLAPGTQEFSADRLPQVGVRKFVASREELNG
jgi:hypothetical protein